MVISLTAAGAASSSNKKAKVINDRSTLGQVNDDDIYSIVKQHILNCPNVEKNHPAILGAIKGLEKENQRQERDLKLRRKFDASVEEPVIVSYSDDCNRREITEDMKRNDPLVNDFAGTSPTDVDESDDDWHDVNRYVEKDEDNMDVNNGVRNGVGSDELLTTDTDSSPLGQVLAREAINLLGKHSVHVRSHLEAFAAVIHAALVTSTLQFICTGVPDSVDEAQGAAKGFAAPIRDIPKTEFLPKGFGAKRSGTSCDCVQIRYRKDGSAGLFVLKVCMMEQDSSKSSVQVSLSSTASKSGIQASEPSAFLEFDIENFFNTESWAKACAKSSSPTGISSTLHYKNLSRLLAEFCRKFDLGNVNDRQQGDIATVENEYLLSNSIGISHVTQANTHYITQTSKNPPIYTTQPDPEPLRIHEPRNPSLERKSLEGHFFQNRRKGDFDGDLAPNGFGGNLNNPMDPLGVLGQNDNMGNLFGPNHPSFTNPSKFYQVPHDDPAFLGVGGMMPRFDPYGPPPTDINLIDGTNVRPGRPNRTFGPNPDHLSPPGFGDNNMFM